MQTTNTFPAGQYYVGDLCYVIRDNWNEVVDLLFPSHTMVEGDHTLANGTRFASFGTAYGDGQYSDQSGKEYLVDSGSIGCIGVEAIDAFDTNGGQLITFTEPFVASSEGGILRFGHISIDTDPHQEDEDDEPDYDEHYGSEDD